MKQPRNNKPMWPHHFLGRRDLLKVGTLGYLGLSLSDYFQLSNVMASGVNSEPKAKSCIMIWLFGGPSHLDTWDVKGNSGFKPISTNVPGIQISELLPKVAKHMDKLSIIRSMKSESNEHSEGSYYAMTGNLPTSSGMNPYSSRSSLFTYWRILPSSKS